MSYEVIERNQYGVLVENTTNKYDCDYCKYRENCIAKCNIGEYYLTDQEAAKLDSQKNLIDLQIENKQLKDRVKELENNTTESLKSLPDSFGIVMYICSECTTEIYEHHNFCPNCGRKIIRN